jgi:hypothetical protein
MLSYDLIIDAEEIKIVSLSSNSVKATISLSCCHARKVAPDGKEYAYKDKKNP